MHYHLRQKASDSFYPDWSPECLKQKRFLHFHSIFFFLPCCAPKQPFSDLSYIVVRSAWTFGPWSWLEVPGHHRHSGGEEKGEGQDALHKEESRDQADQAGRKERWEQDR